MIYVTLIISALAQAAGTPALLKVAPEVVKAMQIYGKYLQAKSVALEPSGASPDDIFKAAKTACAIEHTGALYALSDDLGKTHDQAEAARITLSMLEFSEANGRDESRLKILEIRAGRAR